MTTKTRSRHGMRSTMAAVKLRGLTAVDKRTAAARGLLAWKRAVLDALGGEQHVSPQRLALIDAACRTKVILDALDAYVLSLPSVVNRRNKSVLAIVRDRQSLVNELSRLLAQIGLDCVEPPQPSLADILREHEANKQPTSAVDDVGDEDPEAEAEPDVAIENESTAVLEPEP